MESRKRLYKAGPRDHPTLTDRVQRFKSNQQNARKDKFAAARQISVEESPTPARRNIKVSEITDKREKLKEYRLEKNLKKVQEVQEQKSPFILAVPVGRWVEKKERVKPVRMDLNQTPVRAALMNERVLKKSTVKNLIAKSTAKKENVMVFEAKKTDQVPKSKKKILGDFNSVESTDEIAVTPVDLNSTFEITPEKDENEDFESSVVQVTKRRSRSLPEIVKFEEKIETPRGESSKTVSEVPSKAVIKKPVGRKAGAGIKKVDSVKEPGIKKMDSAKELGITKMDPAKKPGISKVDPVKEPGIKKMDSAKELGIKKMDSVKEAGIKKVDPAKKPGISKVDPAKKPGISKVDPAKEVGISKVDPVKESGSSNHQEPGIKKVYPSRDPAPEKVNPIKRQATDPIKRQASDPAISKKKVQKVKSLESLKDLEAPAPVEKVDPKPKPAAKKKAPQQSYVYSLYKSSLNTQVQFLTMELKSLTSSKASFYELLPENQQISVDKAIQQGNLLLTDKLGKFGDILEDFEADQNEPKKVTEDDVENYWYLIYEEIEKTKGDLSMIQTIKKNVLAGIASAKKRRTRRTYVPEEGTPKRSKRIAETADTPKHNSSCYGCVTMSASKMNTPKSAKRRTISKKSVVFDNVETPKRADSNRRTTRRHVPTPKRLMRLSAVDLDADEDDLNFA